MAGFKAQSLAAICCLALVGLSQPRGARADQSEPAGSIRQITEGQACRGCTIERSLVVTLRDDSVLGSITKLSTVHVTSNGTYIIGTSDAGVPFLANRQGYVVRPIGRRGQGPGEYRGPLLSYETRDSYFIADQLQRRWTKLSKDFEYQGSSRIAVESGIRAPLSDGSYVTSGRNTSRSGVGHPLHVTSADGESVYSFGGDHIPVPENVEPRPLRLTIAADTVLWVAHPDHYRLEKWTTKGKRVAVYERQNPWLPTVKPHIADLGAFRITDIRLDASGRLWVHLTAFGSRNTIIEVIDTSRSSVLATTIIKDWIAPPARLMPGFGTGYLVYYYREASSGEPLIDVFAFELRR
ncbi:MAG: hypothetical protein ACRENP_10545 [Longimicrobiales bacterium]